jgi:hypothetical protein
MQPTTPLGPDQVNVLLLFPQYSDFCDEMEGFTVDIRQLKGNRSYIVKRRNPVIKAKVNIPERKYVDFRTEEKLCKEVKVHTNDSVERQVSICRRIGVEGQLQLLIKDREIK